MRNARLISLLILAVPLSSITEQGNAQATPTSAKVCPTVIGIMATGSRYRAPIATQARVEIRQCELGSETVQLVGWRSGEREPFLVVETGDFGVVQSVARANVFLVETGGATTDQAFVIVFEKGTPRLSLRRVTRGTSELSVTRTTLTVTITGIYKGDAEPGRETHAFPLDQKCPRSAIVRRGLILRLSVRRGENPFAGQA